jgi:biotin operon repressor
MAFHMQEKKQLRERLNISIEEANKLYNQLKADGVTVEDHLAGLTAHGSSNKGSSITDQDDRVAIFKMAGDLIKLAGTKERAEKALEMFDTLV